MNQLLVLKVVLCALQATSDGPGECSASTDVSIRRRTSESTLDYSKELESEDRHVEALGTSSKISCDPILSPTLLNPALLCLALLVPASKLRL